DLSSDDPDPSIIFLSRPLIVPGDHGPRVRAPGAAASVLFRLRHRGVAGRSSELDMPNRKSLVIAAFALSTFAGGTRAQHAAPAPAGAEPEWRKKLDVAARELAGLNAAQAKAGGGPDVQRLQKQVEIQQKQIETL